MIFNRLIKKLSILSSFFILLFVTPLYAADFYWENPVLITQKESVFPVTVTNGNNTYIFWQEVDSAKKEIYLNLRQYHTLTDYSENLHFAGPFKYSGEEVPNIYSAAVNASGKICVAVLSDVKNISVFISEDKCKSFSESRLEYSQTMIAPRVYALSSGSFKIFTSVGEETSFTIFTADSADGKSWSGFSQFSPCSTLTNPFLPYMIADSNGVNVVVFQAYYKNPENGRDSFQLYKTQSVDGKNWNVPVLLTDENSLSGRAYKGFAAYQNQKPLLHNFEGKTYLLWERTESVDAQLWIGELSETGLVKGTCEAITHKGNASNGILFNFDQSLYITWFDTRSGREGIYFARKDGSFWNEYDLLENRNSNSFAYPVLINEKDDESKSFISFVFQQNSKKSNKIALLSPDKTANPPSFVPVSFTKGKKSNKKDISLQINFPSDSSNIAGYSCVWSKDYAAEPVKQLQYFTKDNRIKFKAESDDGDYYFSARVVDYAGNWSEPAVIKYTLDTTPPAAPEINFDNLDKYGFINSNTYSLKWNLSADPDAASYIYRIDYIADIPKNMRSSSRHPVKLSVEQCKNQLESLEAKYEKSINRQRKISLDSRTTKTVTKKYYNQDNGIYVLSVAAIDDVGNIGAPSSKMFVLNKFEPRTFISSVETSTNDVGEISLTITGGGFTYDGTVSKIYIDADGKEPYSLVLEKEKGDFKVQNNKRISDVKIGSELEEGTYKIGLLHTDRGLFMSGAILKIQQNGTVKIEGEYKAPEKYSQEFIHYKYTVSIYLIILILIIILGSVTVLFVFMNLGKSIQDTKVINDDVEAVIKGEAMKEKNKKEKLPSLKQKLILFTYILIILVVFGVSVLNGFNVISMQRNTMAQALQNRSEVLLESLSTGVKNFFPSNNILELTALPLQKDAMNEVKYITIIGQKQGVNSAENLNYVWATNDPEISQKINTAELIYGESEITDEVILEITRKMPFLDSRIAEQTGNLSSKIEELRNAAAQMDINNLSEIEIISQQQADLRNEIDLILNSYAKDNAGSYPFFNTEKLDMSTTDYIFYRPVVYRQGNSGNYIHGLVILELSTVALVESVEKQTLVVIVSGIVVALIAILLGGFGARLFASFIVKPIKKLEQYVIKIGQTKTKKDLRKQGDIKINTKDEVERLGNAINLMTHELINNEVENDLLMDGSSVQNAFLPLVKGTTYSEYDDSIIQCYGYYQAQTGVSGDFFDYRKLDDSWYGFIKSDASGHGAPAALIVTVVATIYTEYFKNWTYKKNGTGINTVVNQINDFISNLNLSGKFATLMVGLFNHKTGELYLCNAGDNIVHIYEAAVHKVKTITLANTPTAGVFSTDMVDMRGGFKVEKYMLNHGDVLFLYTDGIEESTRRVRFADFTVQKTETKSTRMNSETHQMEEFVKVEDRKEEFGPERVCDVIEAVFNKQKYILEKEDNPMQGETLEFDFTDCKGTLEDVIFALASLEKVFRLYKPENLVTLEDYIRIDRKIDEFLSLHFNRYEYYSRNKVEIKDVKQYFDYNLMREDEQSDDLTLLALKRL